MKVVLFCGGQGLRIRDYAEGVPKPMVPIGYRPVVWHVMKYYAHFGHKDFILCLGYRSDVIKNYFLNYSECISNDFILSDGGKKVELLNSDVSDWRITFADTGLHSNIGQRLKAVEPHLNGETEFLANYSDGLTDLPLPTQIDEMRRQGKIASFLCARPNSSYHFVDMEPGGRVKAFQDVRESDIRVNAGYFVFRKEIFRYMRRGEELVHEPFQRLIKDGQLLAHAYDGFWMSMDTFKDKQTLDDMYSRGSAAWEVWAGGRDAIKKAG
jgi:glucose-1-phosphate cytidylyltransferase